MIKLFHSLTCCLKRSEKTSEPLIVKTEAKQKVCEMTCRCDPKCQHTLCDFSPILRTKDDQIQRLENILYMRDSVISRLNDRIQYNENSLNCYSENYQQLVNENKMLRNDNDFLVNSKLYSKKINSRSRPSLCVVPEHGVFQDKKTIFLSEPDMSSEQSI